MLKKDKLADLEKIVDVISLEEEKELLQSISKELLKPDANNDRSGVIRFGDSVYRENIISGIIPEYLLNLSKKLIEKNILDKIPASVTVNIYNPGDTIRPHIDLIKAGPVITILSLASEAEFILTNKNEKISMILEPRSVIQLKDEYRTIWKHSVAPVKNKRVSIVFRQDGK